MAKAYIFDYGGVIINIDYHATIKAFEQLGLNDFKGLYTQAAQSELFDDIETGKISQMHFINRLLDLLPEGTTANQVGHAWNAMILDIPKKRLDLLDRLKEEHDIFLLSNTNEIHVDQANRSLKKVSNRPIDDYFKKVYLSHLINDRKPHASAFQKIIDENQLEKSEVVFIDDSIQHIESAQKLGLQTIHLQGELCDHPAFS